MAERRWDTQYTIECKVVLVRNIAMALTDTGRKAVKVN